MPFTVMLSPDAKEYLDSLDDKRARNIRKHLKELEKDPIKPRAACDIDIVALITKRGYKRS
jgi:mRNA-degrading endonuclease RelE of RelBE toxin-antitoxin system